MDPSTPLVGSPYIYEPYFSGRRTLAPDLRVWMSAGRYEGAICEGVETMSHFMPDTGIAAHVTYSREGHSFGTWRHAVAEMLPYFFGQ